jgi:ferredoxin
MDWKEAKNTADWCGHCGMCKTDFLDTGICPSGAERRYVSYFPQGRLELYHALADGLVPVTERLVDIANSCTFCGRCDKQCYFLVGLRPTKTTAAMKKYVDAYLAENKPVAAVAEDETLRDLRQVVGDEWATNDPAILISYTRDLAPISPRRPSKYIVMPESAEQVVGVIKTANKHQVSFVTRGTGQLLTLVPPMGGGAAITVDVSRMDKVTIDPDRWTANVQAGVLAFNLQREAEKRGLLADTAEPAACVCGNIGCTGLVSLFNHSHGFMANHYVDMEIATPDGKLITSNDRDVANLFKLTPPESGVSPSRGIITRVTTKLYPLTGDEQAICVPFPNLDEAVTMTRELGKRNIGIGASIASLNFYSMFASPTYESSKSLKRFLEEKMGIEQLLIVLGDKYAIKAVKDIAEVTVDQDLARTFMLGIPGLITEGGLEMLSRVGGDGATYKALLQPQLLPLWEMILTPSPDNLSGAVDEDMRDFFAELYRRPEMTDLFWLNKYRPVSPRMKRNHAACVTSYFLPLKNETIIYLYEKLREIGDKHGVENDLAFIVPLENAKYCRLEWDYYYDQTDEEKRRSARAARMEVASLTESLVKQIKGLKPYEWVVNQGFARQESLLYT